MAFFARAVARAAGSIRGNANRSTLVNFAPTTLLPRYFAVAPRAAEISGKGTAALREKMETTKNISGDLKALERDRRRLARELKEELKAQKKATDAIIRAQKKARKDLLVAQRRERRDAERAVTKQKRLEREAKMRATKEKNKLKKQFTQSARLEAATPKRVPNAYALFVAEQKQQAGDRLIHLTETRAKWSKLTEDQKQVYRDRSKALTAKRHEALKLVPKRPPTAYLRFSMDFNAKAKEQGEEVTGDTQTRLQTLADRAKKAGEAWKNLDEATKTKYKIDYRIAFEKYKKDLAKYLDERAPVPRVIANEVQPIVVKENGNGTKRRGTKANNAEENA